MRRRSHNTGHQRPSVLQVRRMIRAIDPADDKGIGVFCEGRRLANGK